MEITLAASASAAGADLCATSRPECWYIIMAMELINGTPPVCNVQLLLSLKQFIGFLVCIIVRLFDDKDIPYQVL